MKAHGSMHFFLAILAFVALILAACSAAIPVTGNASTTPQPAVTETVAVTTSQPPTDAATTAVPATLAPTDTPQPTSTDGPTLAPTATFFIRATPTVLLLANVPIEGGDPNHAFFAMLIFPKWQPAATTSLWFQVQAHKPSTVKTDGKGIDHVDFTILDNQGNQVYFHTEKTSKYCAFGGGEPNCTVYSLASNNYSWPDGTKMYSGTYTISIVVTASDGAEMNGGAKFKIQVP